MHPPPFMGLESQIPGARGASFMAADIALIALGPFSLFAVINISFGIFIPEH